MAITEQLSLLYSAHLDSSDTPLDRDQWEAENTTFAGIPARDFAAFLRGYVVCALWSSTDGENETLQGLGWGEGELAKRTDECAAFVSLALPLLLQYAEQATHSPEYSRWELAGHDFWLTRNGHGVGFWDRGLDQLGDDLSALCGYGTACPPVEPYVGDDGHVYS